MKAPAVGMCSCWPNSPAWLAIEIVDGQFLAVDADHHDRHEVVVPRPQELEDREAAAKDRMDSGGPDARRS